jgi:hypothetical protein
MARPRLGKELLVKMTIMVEPQMLEDLDRFAAHLQARHRSMRVDRSTATREAIALGLAQAGFLRERTAEDNETPSIPPPRAKRTARKATDIPGA